MFCKVPDDRELNLFETLALPCVAMMTEDGLYMVEPVRLSPERGITLFKHSRQGTIGGAIVTNTLMLMPSCGHPEHGMEIEIGNLN